MKICMRGGHTEASPGASASINELSEDRKVYKRVIYLLREVGNEVYDVTPPETYAYPAELNYGINETNRINPEVFFSIHFNSYNGAKGSEVCIYPGSSLTSDLGKNILSNLQDLGFVNRGLKPRSDLGELTNIKCESAIIEVCFVQEPDASLYKSLGVEKIARDIANGIDSRVKLEEEEVMKKIVTYLGDADIYIALPLSQKFGCPVMKEADFKVSGLKVDEVVRVGGVQRDRFETIKVNSNKYL